MSAEAAEAASAVTTPASGEEIPDTPTETAKKSAAKQTQKAKDAAGIVPGVVAP